MSYFAVTLARSGDNWIGQNVDLDEVESFDDIIEAINEENETADTALLFVEEDDEYVGIVRVDKTTDEPQVFLSDARATESFSLATMLAEGVLFEVPSADEDDDTEAAAVVSDAEPLGDAELLADLGIPPTALLELCAHEGTLPADVISAVCEKAGCLDELEAVRDV